MYIEIDFNSDEALYLQIRNQIILGIATSELKEGDALPSVRALADTVGINMHTVNKAYALLREEGFVRVDRRHGVMIAVDMDKLRTMSTLKSYMRPVVAEGIAKGISRDEMKSIIDCIYDDCGCE